MRTPPWKHAPSLFSTVTLGGLGKLRIVQGDEERLSIEATPEMLEKITTKVRDGELRLGLRKGSMLPGLRLKDKRVTFDLTMKDITSIRLSGVGDVEANAIRSTRIELTALGSGGCACDTGGAGDLPGAVLLLLMMLGVIWRSRRTRQGGVK